MSDRRDAIAAVITYHGTLKGGVCMCGHKYRPGASISHHKAKAIDAALLLFEAGVTVEQIEAMAASAFNVAREARENGASS